MASFDLKEIERRMRGALGVLKQEFGGLRTGRANASLLDPIMVMAYGNPCRSISSPPSTFPSRG